MCMQLIERRDLISFSKTFFCSYGNIPWIMRDIRLVAQALPPVEKANNHRLQAAFPLVRGSGSTTTSGMDLRQCISVSDQLQKCAHARPVLCHHP